jgi:signal transduction histidine kinase
VDADEQGRRPKTLSDFAGALARELTDPMSIVQGRLELLLELGVSDAVLVQRHLEVALDHARRVTAILRNLRLVGRVLPGPATESTPVSRVVHEALLLVGPRSDRVIVDLGNDPRVGAEEAMLARVVGFLVRRALDASGQSPIHLRVRQGPKAVTMRIGPPGRVRAEPMPEGRDWMLDSAILAGIGGRLTVRPAGVGIQFEVDLPLGAPDARRRPVRREAL